MKSVPNCTDINDFFSELSAGTFDDKLGITLSEVALGTVMHGGGNKKGKVTIELTITKVGDNDQVFITSKLTKSAPTKRGKKIEEDTTDTPYFVGKGGVITIDAPKEDNNGQFQLNEA